MALLSDEELAVRLQQGDEGALATLVERYHKPVYAYIFRMVGEYHTTQDIVQEAFIKICRNIHLYNPQRTFRPWLYTIASNTCKDYLKKPDVQKVAVSSAVPEERFRVMETPEELVLNKMKQAEVSEAIVCLDEIYREVLILRYYQELKLEEIGQVLGIPTGTVKSRLAAGLKLLRRRFEEKGWGR